MPVWFLIMLAGTAALVVAKKAAARGLSFTPGTYIVCLPPGADGGLLNLNFTNVSIASETPAPNGGVCYFATATSSFTTNVFPSGTTASKVS